MLERITRIGLYGDSILKGIQVNPNNHKYIVDNHIDVENLSEKYDLSIQNFSSFGCTVTKGKMQMNKRLTQNIDCDAIIMDYGGNDCDYNWREIAMNPEGAYNPNTPLELFIHTYNEIIDTLRIKGIQPILTTLPPLEPQRFFDWFCKDLNQQNILKWLGGISTIYHHQEHYSKVVEQIAKEKMVPLIDIRSRFLAKGDVGQFLCEDGTHPNTYGQRLIAEALDDFAKNTFVYG